MAQPTYDESAKSDHYTTGKALMQAGDFEQAMQVIAEGLEQTRERLLVLSAANGTPAEEVDLHESIAPFHYLYGTTLLYSIEESTDAQQQMTVGDQQVENTPPDAASAPATSEHAAGGGSTDAAAVAASLISAMGGGDGGNNATAEMEAIADDMQIAWENLDAARAIVERLLVGAMESSSMEDRRVQYMTDLAQILLREGDLQRFNGRYDDAIRDYQSCLDMRLKMLETGSASASKADAGTPASEESSKYSRKIADVYYNLGLSHLTYASELQKEPDSTNPQEVHATMDEATRKAVSIEHRTKGIHQYFQCGRVLSGRIALLCGEDPDAFLAANQSASEDGSIAGGAKPAAKAGLKTTGLVEHGGNQDIIGDADVASRQLAALRNAVANMTSMDATTAATVADLREFLDELQETIDEATKAEEAVREASAIRAQAQKAAAMGGESCTTAPDGSTTQIGFGPSTLPTNPTGNANFASAASASGVVNAAGSSHSTASGKPVMVVKKKKKRQAVATVNGDQDSKPPASADAKRAKTE